MDIQVQSLTEPRGIIRILQFIFSIVAFATTTGFSVTLDGNCNSNPISKPHSVYEYPFIINDNDICDKRQIILNVSSDCQFFVATGVLSFLYCILIIFVYVAKDELYQSRKMLPKADFIITLILAVFWLSGSAAWSNGTSQLKFVTDVNALTKACELCTFTIGSFSKLNISLIVGFLNFFLWASNLWFIYKETAWFPKPSSSTTTTTA